MLVASKSIGEVGIEGGSEPKMKTERSFPVESFCDSDLGRRIHWIPGLDTFREIDDPSEEGVDLPVVGADAGVDAMFPPFLELKEDIVSESLVPSYPSDESSESKVSCVESGSGGLLDLVSGEEGEDSSGSWILGVEEIVVDRGGDGGFKPFRESEFPTDGADSVDEFFGGGRRESEIDFVEESVP